MAQSIQKNVDEVAENETVFSEKVHRNGEEDQFLSMPGSFFRAGSMSNVRKVRVWMLVVESRVTNRAFPTAFAAVGLTQEQSALGDRCRAELSMHRLQSPVETDLPTLTELYEVVGRPRRLPLGWLFHLSRGYQDPSWVAASHARTCAAGTRVYTERHTWSMRLHSSSSRAPPKQQRALLRAVRLRHVDGRFEGGPP